MVDASVAHAAGDVSLHPTSKQCRETLLALSDFSAVFCPNLKAEWRKHESAFARAWKIKMIQEGKAKFFDDDQIISRFKRFIDDADTDVHAKNAMDKDAHLVSSALSNDKIVVALDEKVRRLFSRHCLSFKGVRKILWSNPIRAEDNTIGWLRAGAKREEVHTLKSYSLQQD